MIALLSRDAELYSTRVIKEVFEKARETVVTLDVLKLEVKIGQGVFLKGEKITPRFIIPRFSSTILLAGLAVIREWEREGIPILNGSASLALAHDQLATLQCLSKNGLSIPQTSFCSQPSDQETFHSLAGEEAKVVKLLNSSQGKGVTYSSDSKTTRSLLSTLATLHSSGITQKFYPEAQGEDIRIIILKGEVIGAIKRTSREGEFRANIHQGGSVSTYQPNQEEASLAIQATEALGLSFAGVDLIKTEKGFLILEVNASPGLEGVEQGTEGRVAQYLIKTNCPPS